MMGERRLPQGSLFYEFRLEDHVPADHLIRGIDRFVDLSGIRRDLAPFYSAIGRPSIDPELMIRMLIVGYCFGIRSERRLCQEVHLNLAYRWFCRLDLTDAVPDHSTFSKNRHGRFRDSDLFRRLFESVLARCIAEGLVGGEGLRRRCLADQGGRQPRGRDRARTLVGRGPCEPRHHGVSRDARRRGLRRGDAGPAEVRLAGRSRRALVRRGSRQGAFPLFRQLSGRPGERGRRRCRGDRADPAGGEQGGARHGRAHAGRFGLYPERLVADTAYGSAETLAWLVHEQGIEPHIPVIDKSRRGDGSLGRDDFVYDLREDAYRCPEGKWLRHYRRPFRTKRSGVDEDGMMRYRASKTDCDVCPLKPRCTPKEPGRKIMRSIHEGARELVRCIAKTDAFVVSLRERKKVEMLFAHLKRILKLDRLRLRGPNGARDEFLLAATAQNLRKLAKLVPEPA